MDIAAINSVFYDFIPASMGSDANRREQQVLKQSIKNHLEQLLNARRPYLQSAHPIALRQYGLPDLSQFNPHATEDCLMLCQAIQTTIGLFEPRLVNVQVEMLDISEEKSPDKVSLKIIGQLKQHKDEIIEFISWLNPVTHRLRVEEMV